MSAFVWLQLANGLQTQVHQALRLKLHGMQMPVCGPCITLVMTSGTQPAGGAGVCQRYCPFDQVGHGDLV